MAFVYNRQVNADDLLNYARDVGAAEGSKENQYATLQGRERQGARAQEAAIAAAQFGQHAADRATNVMLQRENDAARLRANAMDNAAGVAQARLRGEQEKQAHLNDLEQVQMTKDLEARNKALGEFGGTIPDATQGPLQAYDHALDNQNLYVRAAAQDRDALQQKFATGDPNAIQAALNSGRARLTPTDQRALEKAEADMAKVDTDKTLHASQKAAAQRELALRRGSIIRRAQWLPDEQQPKSLQEQVQSRVATIKDPNSDLQIPGYVDSKGNFNPLRKYLPEPKPDPNAPKPPKVYSEEEKKLQYAKLYNETYKSMIKVGAQGETHPDHEAVVAQMNRINEGYAAANGAAPAAPKTIGDAVVNRLAKMFGITTPAPAAVANPSPLTPTPSPQTAPAVPGTPPVPNPPPRAAAPAPAPKKMEPIYVGERTYQPVGAVQTSDGKSLPIVEVKVPGTDKPMNVVVEGKKFLMVDIDKDGNSVVTGEYVPPKFDAKNKPTGAGDAVYVHSNDAAGAKRAAEKGQRVYDEHGILYERKKK